MEVEVLGSEATYETICDITRASGVWIVRKVTRQSFAILHLRDSATLKFLLTKKDADLSHVYETSLGSSQDHS
jgi:hypothetical protein